MVDSAELRTRELQEAVQRFTAMFDKLDRDSSAYRIFDRMRNEQPVGWLNDGEYISKRNAAHLTKWREIAAKVLVRVDPDGSRRKSRSSPAPVSRPAPAFTTTTLDRAIADAEALISSQGPRAALTDF